MHRTFEAMISGKVHAAATGDAVKSFKMLNSMTTGIPSTPAEQCDECPGTAKAPDQDK
jgi:hypothetical protein